MARGNLEKIPASRGMLASGRACSARGQNRRSGRGESGLPKNEGGRSRCGQKASSGHGQKHAYGCRQKLRSGRGQNGASDCSRKHANGGGENEIVAWFNKV